MWNIVLSSLTSMMLFLLSKPGYWEIFRSQKFPEVPYAQHHVNPDLTGGHPGMLSYFHLFSKPGNYSWY